MVANRKIADAHSGKNRLGVTLASGRFQALVIGMYGSKSVFRHE